MPCHVHYDVAQLHVEIVRPALFRSAGCIASSLFPRAGDAIHPALRNRGLVEIPRTLSVPTSKINHSLTQ